ncbi:hypothetical protein [Rossellomorea sp. BNER]|uniref:hypothetical protein n=1 Tax=Rossellomorea sp. BNER TaxID=2962031 RepID=UPI003AF2FF0A|nr:hypothetical protein [Rossellomorea sp. BNER]
MYFPKLNILKTNRLMNDYLINTFDGWLASQSEMYTDYLNPLEFVAECRVNKKLALSIFSLASSIKYFESHGESQDEKNPLLKVKYILDCPYCNENINTYFSRNDIPQDSICCKEDMCYSFLPADHPEKINIFFELLDDPILSVDDELSIYEKKPSPPLTVADEDSDLLEAMWQNEERKGTLSE